MDFSKKKMFSADSVTENGIYSYLDCDVIIIDRYVPSRLENEEVCLAQDELPGGGTVIYFEREYCGSLALRVPSDSSLNKEVSINGEAYDYALLSGGDAYSYALVSGPFEANCRVLMTISVEAAKEELSSVSPDTSLIPEFIITDNGQVSFSDSRSRILASLDNFSDNVTLTLPEGWNFIRCNSIPADYSSDIQCNSRTFALSQSLFTAYTVDILSPDNVSFRSFDLVLMQAPEDPDACLVHAYTPIVGAFSGEACYVIDYSGSIKESGTHGTQVDSVVGIDPVTGYRWGQQDRSTFCFELENGCYELLLSCTDTSARVIASPGEAGEKLLAEHSPVEAERFIIRITNNLFVLRLSDSDSTTVNYLLIRAVDTIAVESGYELISPVSESSSDSDSNDFEDDDYESDDFEFEAEVSSDSHVTRKEPTSAAKSAVAGSSASRKYKPEVHKHINNKLAGKKNAEAVKTVGIVTGAVALAAGIISLFTRNRD